MKSVIALAESTQIDPIAIPRIRPANTEEILLPNELLLILETSQVGGLFSPGLAWYYIHVSLVPVRKETQHFVFTAQLLLVDKIRNARYRIRLWPAPVNGSDHNLQVQTPEDVAVDTQHGRFFEPHNCASNELTICILIGDVAQRASCLFIAARETGPEGYAEKVAPAMYAISTYG